MRVPSSCDLNAAVLGTTAYPPVVTYPPQSPGGWPDQPPQGQPPQQPYPGAGADPFGPPPGHSSGAPSAGDEPSGFEQYSLDTGWQQQPQQYEQPGAQPPPYGAPLAPGMAPPSGPPAGYQPSGPPAGYQPGLGGLPPPGGPVPPKKRSIAPWLFVGGGALVLVLAIVAVVALVSTGKDKKPPVADPSSSSSARPSTSATAKPSPGPSDDGVHGNKIIDSATGWGFTKAGSPWVDSVAPAAKELQSPVGQSVKIDTNVYATMQLGKLSDDFDYSGPKDLKSVKSDLATSILKGYYGTGAKVDAGKDHLDEQLTQLGRKAWLWAFDVTYTSSAGKKTTEYVVIAVLDAGDGTAAGFWGSVPDGHDDLNKQMRKAAGTLTPKP